MKKTFVFVATLCLSIGIATQTFAAAELPSSSVWFAPTTAAVGEAITINALVYNSQSVDATVTVVASTPTLKISTVTELIPKATAKTIVINWTMPKNSSAVTVAVTTALDHNKKSLPALVGKIGTVTIAPSAVAPVITPTATTAFPGAAQLKAWFGPWMAKIEPFRIKEAKYFTTLRDTKKAALGITAAPATTDGADKNAASKAFGNPFDYITYIVAIGCATLFASQGLFYVAIILLALLVLRFIVNLIF